MEDPYANSHKVLTSHPCTLSFLLYGMLAQYRPCTMDNLDEWKTLALVRSDCNISFDFSLGIDGSDEFDRG